MALWIYRLDSAAVDGLQKFTGSPTDVMLPLWGARVRAGDVLLPAAERPESGTEKLVGWGRVLQLLPASGPPPDYPSVVPSELADVSSRADGRLALLAVHVLWPDGLLWRWPVERPAGDTRHLGAGVGEIGPLRTAEAKRLRELLRATSGPRPDSPVPGERVLAWLAREPSRAEAEA